MQMRGMKLATSLEQCFAARCQTVSDGVTVFAVLFRVVQGVTLTYRGPSPGQAHDRDENETDHLHPLRFLFNDARFSQVMKRFC